MREGLVRYIGHRRGKFEQRVGAYQRRSWSTQQPHHERWLLEAEARLWEKVGPWRVTSWRETNEQELLPTVIASPPAPPAVHLATALEQAALSTKQAEVQRELVDATFVMANSGVIHVAGCPNAPARAYKTFSSLERAMANEDFSKAHQPCCRKHLKALRDSALESIAERREGAVAQMNSVGESYGLGQDEA